MFNERVFSDGLFALSHALIVNLTVDSFDETWYGIVPVVMLFISYIKSLVIFYYAYSCTL